MFVASSSSNILPPTSILPAMAVLNTPPGVRVWITASKEDLKDYNDLDEDPVRPLADKMVVSYIEAVSSMSFAVNLELSSPFVFDCKSIAFLVEVDGMEVEIVLCKRTDFRGKCTSVVEGVIVALPDSNLGISKFYFVKIKTGIFGSFSPFL